MEKLIRVRNYHKVVLYGLFQGYGANDQGHIIRRETGKPCKIMELLGDLRYAKLEAGPSEFVSIRTDRFIWQC